MSIGAEEADEELGGAVECALVPDEESRDDHSPAREDGVGVTVIEALRLLRASECCVLG